MTPARRSDARDRLVKELFERVLDAPPEERDAILGAQNGADSLRDDVAELLRHESELGDFLETPAGHRVLGAPAGDVRLVPGDEVADFTVIGALGEGGGGVVYEAEQREPRRRVALKLIRVRTRSADALDTFRDEAATLARLHHAAIAHVYAAGVRESPGGAQPWIAMERIDRAKSIVRHARDESLGRDERLRLFVEVCAALHHAHENGVIHRDVTPGNVLVDAEGRPKVVDFGVACGIAEGDEPTSDAAGTLAYASPEQLTGERGRTDRRADVYGLGALLHELLTGSVPLDVDDLSVTEAARAKREIAVPAPSTRGPGIPPDLDAIVLRALAPDRDARYGSAAELAADVSHFLASEPVAAYAGGALYQLGKFVRRRRAATAAITGIAAALVIGAGVSVGFALENAAARRLAERRSYVAEISAAAAALRVDDVAEARLRLDRAPAALRDWEWRHLASRVDVSDETVAFGERELWSGSASADGELFALTGLDRAVGTGASFAALVRRDGSTVREWEFSGSARLAASAITADGRWFGCGRPDGSVLLYDVAAGRETLSFAAHTSWVIAMAFSAAGSRFATVSDDGTAALWSREDGKLVHRFTHPDRVICVSFETIGSRLATGCRDGMIRIWDTETGQLVRTLAGHEGSVEGVAFSRDGTRLASSSRDRTVRLWHLGDAGGVVVGRSHSSNVRGVAFDPDGRCFVSASWDGTLRVWDPCDGVETGLLRGHGSVVTSACFLRDGSLLSFSLDHTVKRWDADRTDVPTCVERRDFVTDVAFDPDGSRVAVTGTDGSLSILDARSGRLKSRVETTGGGVSDVEFLGPRSLLLLVGSGELQFWELPSGSGTPACVRRISVLEGSGSMCLASASTAVLAAQAILTIVDLPSGSYEKRQAPMHVTRAACDGRGGIAVGGPDGSVGFCSAEGRWTTARPALKSITSVAFDETGERILAACSDGTARVLRTADLATLIVLRGHSGSVHQAEFLPGGRRVVTVSYDHTVRLWDAGDGENVLVLHEHGYPVNRVAVSSDGSRIATAAIAEGNGQTAVKFWTSPPPSR